MYKTISSKTFHYTLLYYYIGNIINTTSFDYNKELKEVMFKTNSSVISLKGTLAREVIKVNIIGRNKM